MAGPEQQGTPCGKLRRALLLPQTGYLPPRDNLVSRLIRRASEMETESGQPADETGRAHSARETP
ncbi:MAG TPA: hypothetical protein VGH53_04905 [Streptosporangiaceae bacterium]